MTSKKKHGDMDRFVWSAEHIKVHKKNIPKKSEADPLPSSKDPQSEQSPKGGTK